MPKAKWIILSFVLTCIVSFTALLTLYPPAHILAPGFYGVTCSNYRICIEDQQRTAEASRLLEQSLAHMQSKLGPLSYTPRVIFCSTQQCYNTFVLGHSKGETYGTIATVIGPKAWKRYFVSHELIHQWQADNIGFFKRVDIPRWLAEGMAYELSEDPRATLKEPWQSYRERFRQWDKERGTTDWVMAIRNEM